MKTTELKFLNNGKSNGLLIISTPTGSGKSFVANDIMVSDVIALCNAEEVPTQKLIYTTPRLNNLKDSYGKENVLPYLKTKKERDFFEKNYLMLRSHEDTVTDFFLHAHVKQRVEHILKLLPDFKETIEGLVKSVKLLKTAKKSDLEKAAKKEFTEKERAFRGTLKKKLKARFGSPEAIHNAILNDPKWEWIAELYPDSLIYDKRYIAMSVDKLIRKIDPIYDASFLFTNEPEFWSSVIFIDEFDSCKDTFLQSIIDDGTRTDEHIDLIVLFSKLHYALNEKDFPMRCFYDSDNKVDKILVSSVEELKERSRQIYDKFSLKYAIKNNLQEAGTQSVRLLFQDDVRYLLQSERSVRASISTDDEEKTNWISYIKQGQSGEATTNGYNIEELAGDIDGYFKFAALVVGRIANNIIQRESHSRETAQMFEKSVHSIFGLLGFDGKGEGQQTVELEFLTNLVMDHGFIR